jgi:hypothetical protein
MLQYRRFHSGDFLGRVVRFAGAISRRHSARRQWLDTYGLNHFALEGHHGRGDDNLFPDPGVGVRPERIGKDQVVLMALPSKCKTALRTLSPSF